MGRMNTKSIIISEILPAVLALVLLALGISVFSGCSTEPGPNSESETSVQESVVRFEEDFSVSLGGTLFTPTLINCDPAGSEIVLYDSSYSVNGVPALSCTLDSPERELIGLYPDHSEKNAGYGIFSIVEEVGSACPIPLSGFVLSIPKDLLEGLRIRKGQLARCAGEYSIPERETLSYGTFYPDTEYTNALERRISIADPEVAFTEHIDDYICYFSENYESAEYSRFPEECTIVTLEKNTSRSSRIVGIRNGNERKANECALVFCGSYNRAYANEYLKEGTKVFINRLEEVSGISDRPAVLIGSEVCTFDSSNTNQTDLSSDGVYLFDQNHASLGTPSADSDRADVVVMNGIAVLINRAGPTLIPTNGGIVLSFTGKYAHNLELSVGDVVRTCLLDTSALSDNSVRIGSEIFTYDKTNEIRAPEGVSVLYTSAYGASTGANAYGLEIAVEDGVVTDVAEGKGNMTIPANGFVLSIHKDAEQYGRAQAVQKGETVISFSEGIGYSLITAKVTNINTVRIANSLIVYRGKSTTGSNSYGYEIAVDKNGMITGQSYAGNMSIPEGGMVLSAHGDMVSILEKCYCYGADAVFNESEMAVHVINTPESRFDDALNELNTYSAQLSEAKNQLLLLDYESLEEEIDRLSAQLSEASSGFGRGEYESSLSQLSSVRLALGRMTYSMIESHPVENRAVWYQGSEKSDDEVRATIEKLKALNVNALYLATWYRGRFIGFSENELIEHATANGNYDALEGFVRIGHENGIEVHAWVLDFFIGTVEAQEQANTKLAEHFKDMWLIDRNGENTFYYAVSNTNFIFLNPFEEEVQTFLLDFYDEMIRKYDIDGIHLDYIRFPEKNGEADFGYNDSIVKAWQKANNTTVNPATLNTSGALYSSWIRFRQEIINGFVKKVYELVKKRDPSVWLSAAVYPGIPDIKNAIFQDCQNWVDNGYMDELFSMTYSGDAPYVASNARQFSRVCGDKCFYSTGLMAFGDSSEASLGQQMTLVRKSGADGVAVFSLANISPAHYYDPIVNGAFREPSVQASAVDRAVGEQCKFILEKIDRLYVKYGIIDETEASGVRDLLNGIIKDVSGFSFKDADKTAKEKKAFCEQTIKSMEKASSLLLSFVEEQSYKTSMSSDFDEAIHWLTIMSARLAAKE